MTVGTSLIAFLAAPSRTVRRDSELPKSTGKDSAAADATRAKLLKGKVTGEFTDTRIGDILKEFAAQVDMKLDQPVMWTYGTGLSLQQEDRVVRKRRNRLKSRSTSY